MWSPKRIVLLGTSFVLISLGYIGYGFSAIGRIDGLPPLPEAYWPVPPDDPGGDPVRRDTELVKRLKLAFGTDAPELGRAIRLDLRSRGMLLAAETFELLKDAEGRVALNKVSIATIGKDAKNPDVSTVSGQVAIITFDRPVSNMSEIAGRKIAKAELSGRIEIINNRRRPERDQDVRINIPIGPLYYDESTHRIWTHDNIRIEDRKARPRPHIITARGMEMELAVEQPPPPAPGRPASKGRETVGGVKWVELKSAVVMQLHMEGQGNFFDTKASPVAGKKADGKPSVQPSRIDITTLGTFRYEMRKGHDLATFEASPRAGLASSPPQVFVDRTMGSPPLHDTLTCTRLVLRVKRASEKRDKGQKNQETGEGVQVETIHATGPDGEVVMTSDGEKLHAIGADFFHDAVQGITLLKGGPKGVFVNRQDSELVGRDLEMRKRPVERPAPGQPVPRESFDVRSTGPGRISFKDPKDSRAMKAAWSTTLTVTRDGLEDLVTLIGDAEFVDVDGRQEMKADILKVWLDPEEPKGEPAKVVAKDTKPVPGGSRKARHLEAEGNVRVNSRDINIHDTARLVLWFRDVPAPEALPGAKPPEVPKAGRTPTTPVVPAIDVPRKGSDAPRPIDLKARSVEAKILRSPLKNSLDLLTCEGAVVVRQDPTKPTEKGTLVKGDTLRMTAAPEGAYILNVTGDMAELHSDRMAILGPEVTINQHTNEAWVVGDGLMRMDSGTNFQGEKLTQPVPLEVGWRDRMFFNGAAAEFRGEITATQGQARLHCQRMTAHFDKVVSLRQGNRADQPAKVRHMICEREVRVEEKTEKAGKFEKYQRLEAKELRVTTLEPEEGGKVAKGGNQAVASGPGTFRVVDSGEAGPLDIGVPTAGGPKKPAAKPESELRMTHVGFGRQMQANSMLGIASFWGEVRVLHLPTKTHNEDVDIDKILARELPERGMYLRCDRLKVLDRPMDGKPNKQMEGHGRVSVLGRDFSATADSVTYNQAKEQIIFTGKETGPAQLKKFSRPGEAGETVTAAKIIYWRATRRIEMHRVDGVSGSSAPK